MEPLRDEAPSTDWEALHQVGPDLARYTEAIRGVQEASKNLAQGISQALVYAIPTWDFQALLEPLRAASAAFEALPERTRACAAKAALLGWYIGPELPIPTLTELETLEEGDQIDAVFVDHYRANWESVEVRVLERLPVRAPLLKEAFAAHREARYALAIPVLLAQAEGICDDALDQKGHLFASRHGKVQERVLRLEEVAAKEDSRFLDAVLEPLKAALPSSLTNPVWLKSKDIFSRNAILHGLDLGYATEKNALRAISLVDYLIWTLHDYGPGTE